MGIVVLSLQHDAFGLLAPLSSAKIIEAANGDLPNPPLPQVVVHMS
jgi:hypothetical protein